MINKIKENIDSGLEFCVATLVNVRGSAPQDKGAKIIVFPDGTIEGTIGGGKIESHVINYSKDLLSSIEPKKTSFETWNLQKDIGMTCGGEVSIFFELYNHRLWNIVVFGAGHVSQSLCRVLENLSCRLTVVDNRKEWLDRLDGVKGLNIVHKENMSDYVSEMSSDSFVVIMTMGHSTDLPILKKILPLESKFPYLGVIGSIAKRNTIEKELRNSSIESNDFLCPIGLSIGDNSPSEIAMSIAAQLIEYKDKFFKTSKRV